MTDNGLKEIFAELAVAQARTELQFEKTDEKLKSMGIHVGGMAISHGYGTEEYIFNAANGKRLYL